MHIDATTGGVPDRIGIRELNSRLSECVAAAAAGAEITITSHGREVARLSGLAPEDPIERLRADGLLLEPSVPPSTAAGGRRVKAKGSVSELVRDQRR
jgi:prevent-host-death family protein